MYDIVIVGAGPAGTTLARLLDKKYKILLVEKRNLDNANLTNKNKCCGGLLAPDAQAMLAKLDLSIPKDILSEPQMFAVKTIDFDNELTRTYQRHYINIDREKFDRYLLSIVGANVEIHLDTLYKSSKSKDEYTEVSLYNKNKKTYTVRTKLLVGADGSCSLIRQNFFPSDIPKYASIQHWYKTSDTMPYFMSIFDKSITDFYSWMIQKEGYLILGSAIPLGQDINDNFDKLVSKLKSNGYIKGEPVKKEGTLILRPKNISHENHVKSNLVLIGEAAGFISPSSAEGISYALKSGAMLANSINKYNFKFQNDYKKQTKYIKKNIFMKNAKSKIMYNQYFRKLIMLSNFLAIEPVIENCK